MPNYLIIRLQGVMQSWGKHSYEDYRPSELFPTRSALTGLLAACLGIDRNNTPALSNLDASYTYTARQDKRLYPVQRIFDYHTVGESIKATGAIRTDPIQSYREYLYDAHFTVALTLKPNAYWTLEKLQTALRKPVFTPYLGRKSCPITAPLDGGVTEAPDVIAALKLVPPGIGTVYSEELMSSNRLVVRDQSRYGRVRQFDTREVFIHALEDI